MPNLASRPRREGGSAARADCRPRRWRSAPPPPGRSRPGEKRTAAKQLAVDEPKPANSSRPSRPARAPGEAGSHLHVQKMPPPWRLPRPASEAAAALKPGEPKPTSRPRRRPRPGAAPPSTPTSKAPPNLSSGQARRGPTHTEKTGHALRLRLACGAARPPCTSHEDAAQKG